MVSSRRGAGARPPARKPVVRKMARPKPGFTARSRPEGIRWLRADGTPNWSQRIAEKVGDAELLASRPPRTVQHTATILDAARLVYEYKVRGLVVVDASDVLKGVLLTTDLVNYLGGGEYYRIVEVRHGDNIFKALNDESIASIYNPGPMYVDRKASLTSVLQLMIAEGVGFVPVVDSDGVVYGVITEHDLVRHLADKRVGRKVRDHMTSTVVMVEAEAPIREAARLMVVHGFRRLPVVSGGEVKGMVTAKDYVSFFGSNEAFKAVEKGTMSEVLSVPVYEIMTPVVYTVSPDADVGDAAREMLEKGVSSLLVVEDDEVKGIITERDVLVAVAIG